MAHGVVFGDYFLLGRLNRGGMAEVFLAKSLRPGEGDDLFAVKRMLPELSQDRDFVSMFVDEAVIARRLRHPNICRLEAQGEHAHQLYIAMEFIHGKDLKVVQHRARERGEPLPVRYVAYTVARIAEALDYAHNKTNEAGEPEGIVHRDVSPQNILISYEGVPKLIDFGIAKAKSRIAKTQVGILKGKFTYMSPEQATGGAIDHRTDIFALGVVLYELVTGRHAFKGSSDFSTLQRITEGRYTHPQQADRSLPPRLAAVITRALATRPDERYEDAKEMAAALDAYTAEDGRPPNAATLSAFMRKLFRDDYIREVGRIKIYLAVQVPGAAERAAAATAPRSVAAPGGSRASEAQGVGDATAVAPSFIQPGRDSHESDSSGRRAAPAPADGERTTRAAASGAGAGEGESEPLLADTQEVPAAGEGSGDERAAYGDTELVEVERPGGNARERDGVLRRPSPTVDLVERTSTELAIPTVAAAGREGPEPILTVPADTPKPPRPKRATSEPRTAVATAASRELSSREAGTQSGRREGAPRHVRRGPLLSRTEALILALVAALGGLVVVGAYWYALSIPIEVVRPVITETPVAAQDR